MVKTTITPDHAHVELSVPESYIGKKVEILMYIVDDLEESLQTLPASPKKASQFKGILSSELTEQYHQHIRQSRDEWQSRI